jgi:hypothetical protein
MIPRIAAAESALSFLLALFSGSVPPEAGLLVSGR